MSGGYQLTKLIPSLRSSGIDLIFNDPYLQAGEVSVLDGLNYVYKLYPGKTLGGYLHILQPAYA